MRTPFTDFIGKRVMIVGRFIWRGHLSEELGPFLVLTDANQATWGDAKELRYEVDKVIPRISVNVAWIEACYLESDTAWAKARSS